MSFLILTAPVPVSPFKSVYDVVAESTTMFEEALATTLLLPSRISIFLEQVLAVGLNHWATRSTGVVVAPWAIVIVFVDVNAFATAKAGQGLSTMLTKKAAVLVVFTVAGSVISLLYVH